jgi:hypothetical protein
MCDESNLLLISQLQHPAFCERQRAPDLPNDARTTE